MQYGFKNCCNEFEYFIVEDIPAYVNVGESWYIQTIQGDYLIGTYVEMPPLNYAPQTFNWSSGVNYPTCNEILDNYDINCENTTVVTSFELGSGAVVTTNECGCITLTPLTVTCQSTSPSTNGGNNGIVKINIQGGTPPYSISMTIGFSQGSITYNSQNSGLFTLLNNAGENSYFITVTDSDGDFTESVTCILNTPPTQLNATCSTTNTTFYGSPTGSMTVSVNGGTPPYLLNMVGTPTFSTLQSGTKTYPNLSANTYTVNIIDSGSVALGEQQNESVTCTVNDAAQLTYPNTICLTILYCNQTYSLTFTKQSTLYNYRPIYLSTTHPTIGVAIPITLRYETTTNNWKTSAYTQTNLWSVPVTCTPAYSVQFSQQTGNNQPTGTYTSQAGTTFFTGNKTMSSGNCPLSYSLTSTASCPLATPPDGTITFGTIQNGAPPYQYTLYLNNISQGSQNTPIFNNVGAGTYKGVVVDNVGNTLTLAQAPSVTVSNSTVSTVNFVTCYASQPITIIGGGTQSYKGILNGYFTGIPTGNQISTSNFSIQISIYKKTPESTSNINATYTNLKVFKAGTDITSSLSLQVVDTFSTPEEQDPNVGCPKRTKSQATIYTINPTNQITNIQNLQNIQVQVTFQYSSTNIIATNQSGCYEQVDYNISCTLGDDFIMTGPSQCYQYPSPYFEPSLSYITFTKIKNQTITNNPQTPNQWTIVGSGGNSVCANNIIIP